MADPRGRPRHPAVVSGEGPDALVLQPDGGATRLLVWERYRYLWPWAGVIIRPVELVSSVMTSGMLRGLRRRAEHRGSRPDRVVETRAG